MIKTKVLRSMRKTVLGLMLSACVLTTSGVALDNVAMAASDTKKTTSSDTTKPKINMPSSDEENVGSVSFAVTDHAKGSFALVDDESMNVRYGDKVYFYAKPDDGYGFSSISVRCMKKNEDGKFVEDEDMSNSVTLHYNDEVSGVYYFVMPECDIASIQLPTTEVESQLQSTKSVKSKVTDTQDYIVQHLDKKYVNVASDYKITNNNLIDAVYVKNILVDGTNLIYQN